MFVWVLLDFFSRIVWALRQVWKYVWWSFQNIEYSLAQSETIEHMGKAHCLYGPGTIYRAEVLDQLYQQFGLVWPEIMVEDFDLTVRIQTMKYKTLVGHDMFVYTDCPIGFKAHGIQRERWNGGNLSTYMHVGMNRHTFLGGTEMGWQLVWFACRLVLLITAIQIYVSGFVYIDAPGLGFLGIWPDQANAVIEAITAVDSKHYIFVGEDNWDSSKHWNPEQASQIHGSQVVFEAHSYWDKGNIGVYEPDIPPSDPEGVVVSSLRPFVD